MVRVEPQNEEKTLSRRTRHAGFVRRRRGNPGGDNLWRCRAVLLGNAQDRPELSTEGRFHYKNIRTREEKPWLGSQESESESSRERGGATVQASHTACRSSSEAVSQLNQYSERVYARNEVSATGPAVPLAVLRHDDAAPRHFEVESHLEGRT